MSDESSTSNKCIFVWYWKDGIKKKFAVLANATPALEKTLINQCQAAHPMCEVEVEREGDRIDREDV